MLLLFKNYLQKFCEAGRIEASLTDFLREEYDGSVNCSYRWCPIIQENMFRLLTLTVVIYEILLFEGMQGWVYHHNDITMTWEDARNYCKQNYTDMVAIQNMEENKYLMEYLPKGYAQVWIGLRMINNSWTWIGTNQKLENVAMNWAPGEPSNEKNNEECVMMYIQAAANSGKWSNEPCINMKRPLCFQASCTPESCNGHGECVETIGAFTCACNKGFYGDLCENAVRCRRLAFSRRDVMNCFDPHGPFSYNSICTFGCREGYVLKGAKRTQCLASGQWTERVDCCRVQQCETLVVPEHGYMSCIHPIAEFKYNSTCDFSCSEGFALNGPSRLQCKDPEQWSAQNPTCEVLKCLRLEARDPIIMNCSHPYKNFSYDSTCDFSCAEGFQLNGERRVQCTASAEWTKPIPECKAVRCRRLEFFRNVVMNCFEPHGPFRYNSICTFGCREGYALKGSKRTHCLASGQWTEPVALCRVQQCETLVVPEHGYMSCIHPIAEFKYNSTCDFSCSEGFALNGPSRLQCKDPEQWSAQNPTCEAVQCMPLNIPHRGNMDCKHMYGNNSYNATCVFSCIEGFVLHGSNDLQCQASRQWTAEVPSCEATNCTTLVNPEQGTINCSHPFGLFRYNATCDVSCEKGFIVNGSGTVQCGASGQWTPQIPSCKEGTADAGKSKVDKSA